MSKEKSLHFRLQCLLASRTFSLPSSETPDSNDLYVLPDWFDENFYKNRIVKDSEGFWGCRILDSQLSANAGNEPKYER